MKIVVLDGYTLNPGDLSWRGLEALGECIVHDRTSLDQIVERARDAEIVLTNKTPLRKEVLIQLSKLRYIGVLATGFDVVDIEAATEQGITVTNVPAYGTNAVAQFTMAMLLELCHRIGRHDTSVHAGDWMRSPDFCYWRSPLVELTGKTIGLIGLGRIGTEVATLASAFGMRVLAYKPNQQEAPPLDLIKWTSFDELLTHADVVSLHCPLTPKTQGMINKEALDKMKPTAFLLNTSRGKLIDEQELADALNEGRLAGAALDVLSAEPPQRDNPLLTARNCVIKPHIAWATTEARERLMQIAIENIERFLQGHPQNVVNQV